jgi:hypothetical protein
LQHTTQRTLENENELTKSEFYYGNRKKVDLTVLSLLLTLALGRLGTNLLVVLLEGGKVLARASENSPSSMPSPTYQCTKAPC